MRKLTIALMVVAGFVTAQPAAALPIAIVDTGPGDLGGSEWILGRFPTSPTTPDDNQWLAVQFSVSQAWIITGVQGWIDPSVSGDVRFRLYSDSGSDVPGLAGPDATVPISGPGANWYGPSTLSWLILPGNHWLAFEVEELSLFRGSMPSPSHFPLDPEAYSQAIGTAGIYTNFPGLHLDLGVRVFAEAPSSVPDTTPTALLFVLGIGLIAGAGLTRGRRPTP